MNPEAPIPDNVGKGFPHPVIIVGSGETAQRIAANLTDQGVAVKCTASEVITCSGVAGRFQLALGKEDGVESVHAAALVVADGIDSRPADIDPALAAGSRLISIGELESKMARNDKEVFVDSPARIAFFSGWHDRTDPTVAKRMLAGCVALQRQSALQTCFFAGDLKVSASGAEALAQKARQAGTLFFKCSGTMPKVESLGENEFQISGTDELTNMPFRMSVDGIVVDEIAVPTDHLKQLARRLGIEHADDGFAQSDNVRRLNHATNRRGIFVTGGARGIVGSDEALADVDGVCLAVLDFLNTLDATSPCTVAIQQGRCARCLTCYRLCPHGAIETVPRMTIADAACQSCGICAAGCPAGAIEMESIDAKAIAQQSTTEREPDVMVFGCDRSAGVALRLMKLAGRKLPDGVQFIQVPCGGAVGQRHLLDAFAIGAHKVMLFTCHTDNCQAQRGNTIAHQRAAEVSEALAAIGVPAENLKVVTVAANMGIELAGMIDDFVNPITESVSKKEPERREMDHA